MPSHSLVKWRTNRKAQLDQIEHAHSRVGGTGPGRRYATQQVNHAYVMLLASQFQGFCRDLRRPAVCEGSRPIRGLRITVELVLELLSDGYTAHEIVA